MRCDRHMAEMPVGDVLPYFSRVKGVGTSLVW